jgi:hypothetical protein
MSVNPLCPPPPHTHFKMPDLTKLNVSKVVELLQSERIVALCPSNATAGVRGAAPPWAARMDVSVIVPRSAGPRERAPETRERRPWLFHPCGGPTPEKSRFGAGLRVDLVWGGRRPHGGLGATRRPGRGTVGARGWRGGMCWVGPGADEVPQPRDAVDGEAPEDLAWCGRRPRWVSSQTARTAPPGFRPQQAPSPPGGTYFLLK